MVTDTQRRWLLLTVALYVLVPQIESVAREHAVTMSPQDAPALIAAKKIGAAYHESDSDSIAMIVLEGDEKLGTEAHRYYDDLVRALRADPEHVQHVHAGREQFVAGRQRTHVGGQKSHARHVRQRGDHPAVLGHVF